MRVSNQATSCETKSFGTKRGNIFIGEGRRTVFIIARSYYTQRRLTDDLLHVIANTVACHGIKHPALRAALCPSSLSLSPLVLTCWMDLEYQIQSNPSVWPSPVDQLMAPALH